MTSTSERTGGTLYLWRYLPETKDRSLEEIERELT